MINIQLLKETVVVFFFYSTNRNVTVKMLINNNNCFVSFLVKEQFSTFDGEDHECALWLLLKRTQSEDKEVRLQAVQDLANNSHWHGNVYKYSPIHPRNGSVSAVSGLQPTKARSCKKSKYSLKFGLKCKGFIYISSNCSFLIPCYRVCICSAGLSLFPHQTIASTVVCCCGVGK